MIRRVVTVQVAEGGGVPIPQYVELSNTLAGMPPGEYRVTIEPADAPDPILAWLVREAAEAWRVLEAERDPGNIKTMRQWVYYQECLVRLRLDEMGLLDVDDEPAGGEQ